MTDTPALAAYGVSKRYTRRRPLALEGIDLSISPGKITALVGPNGAGKSTLIKGWAGFERPSNGQVEVLGVDPFRQRALALRSIGFVPQGAALYRSLSVADHLTLAASLRPGFDVDLSRQRIDELGIGLTAMAGQLSGGQQSQISLAIAIGTRAPILLLDEPLASLDPLARRDFLRLLSRTVRENGTTALLSSHIVSDVEQAGDNLVILGSGHKLLDVTVQTALATHRIGLGKLAALPPNRSVAWFFGPADEPLTLFEISAEALPDPRLRPASLEELVIGYLAADQAALRQRSS